MSLDSVTIEDTTHIKPEDFQEKNDENSCVDPFDLIHNCDEKGIPDEWNEVKKKVIEKGVNALEDLFDFHLKYTSYFDDWTNYLLACSYFTPQELGFETNRTIRKQLEFKVKRLMKERAKNPHTNMWDSLKKQI